MLVGTQLLSRKTGCPASFKILARKKHVNFLLIFKMKTKSCKTVLIVKKKYVARKGPKSFDEL